MHVLRVDTPDGDYFVGMKNNTPVISRRDYIRFTTHSEAYKFTKEYNLATILEGERTVLLTIEIDPDVIKARECARVLF